jgi:pimeloyl-ACP methyl ester carboxylesterase
MLIDIGEIRLNYTNWGSHDETVVFIHGNLACSPWFDLIGPLVADRFRVIAVDWRGCGASDKPVPLSDYSNYTVRQHALDMLATIRCLGIDRCHLATHSTGGLISTYMVLMEPDRFGKVMALNPVGPMGLAIPPEIYALLEAMKGSREKTRATLALTAPTLFRPESLTSGMQPMFADHATPTQQQLFERLVDQTLQVSDGIWFGTATDLDRHWRTGGLRASQGSIEHRHLVLWGALDPFIPKQDMEEMAARMPHCDLTIVPDVGHSMLIERPEMYAQYFVEFFRGGTG